MSSVPKSLADLSAYWKAQGGVPLGVVGNLRHCAGYHLGKDRIYGDCACRPDGVCQKGLGANDYSVRLSRDRAGLSNAASAIDLGKLVTYAGLRRFSKWLVAACQADRVKYRDVREIIYSPDGETVQRYSGEDGKIHVGPGNGDASHRTHTHISFYRDSAARDKRPLFAPYFNDTIPPDTSTGDAVKSFNVPEARTLARVKDLAWLYDNSALAASAGNVRLSPSRELVLVGNFSPEVRIVAYEPATADSGDMSKAMFVSTADIMSTRVPPDTTPYSAADVAAAESKGWNAARTAALAAVQGVPTK